MTDVHDNPLPTPLDPATADVWGTTVNTALLAVQQETATKTINQNFADKELSRPLLVDYSEKLTVNASATGSVTIDYAVSNHYKLTLTGNVTSLTISNPPASGSLGIMTIEIIQDGTGSRTFAFPSSFVWAGDATAPTVTSTASKKDIVTIRTNNGGTLWDAEISQRRRIS